MGKNKKVKTENAPSKDAVFPHFGKLSFWLTGVFACLIFARPLVSGVTYPWSNTYFQTVLIVLACVFFLAVINSGKGFYLSRAAPGLVLFFLWAGLSAFFSVYKAASLREVYAVFGYFILFFLSGNILDTFRKKEVALNALFFSAFLVSLYAVYQYFWGLDKTRLMVELYHSGEFVPEFITRLGTQRAFSTFVYPPALAGFLTVVIPAAAAAALGEKILIKKIFLIGLSSIAVFALVLTYSKGGWATLAAGGVFFVYLWSKFIVKKAHAGAVILIFAIVALMVLIVFSGLDRRATAGGFVDSYRVRYEYWLAAPGMIAESPLTGSGPGTWGVVYARHKLLMAEETQMAHNNYVQVAAETGPAGLIFFLWFFLSAAGAGVRILKKPDLPHRQKIMYAGVLTGLGAFLFQSLGEFTLYIPGVAAIVFFFAGLLSDFKESKQIKISLPEGKKLFCSALCMAAALVLIFFMRKPMLADRYYEQARVRVEKGDFTGADSLMSRASEIFPGEAKYYYHRGMLYESMPGFIGEAAWMYEKAAKLNPASSAVNFRLANVLWLKSRGSPGDLRDRAVFYMERAVRGYPFSPLYRIGLGRMYHLAGMKDEALSEYKKALLYESGERLSLRRERLAGQLEDVKKWIEEIEREENE